MEVKLLLAVKLLALFHLCPDMPEYFFRITSDFFFLLPACNIGETV